MLKINFNKPKISFNVPLQILETYNAYEDHKRNKVNHSTESIKTTTHKGVQYKDLVQFFDYLDDNANNNNGEDYWYNLLIWGDNLYALNSLKSKFTEKIKLIYIDPPFYTGTDEVIDIPIGLSNKTIKQGPSVIQDIAYKNIWYGKNPAYSFAHWFYERVIEMHKLLRDDGFIVVRFDYHFGHYSKIVLDQIFGPQNFIGDFPVRRMTKTVTEKYLNTQKHLIHQFDNLYIYQKTSKAKYQIDITKAKRVNQDEIETKSNNNIWLDIVGYEKTKKTLYPTENSIELLKRVITTFSKKDDLVADFFSGSGTTLAVASELERKWIGVDLSRYSINEIKKRILNNKKQIPFQLLNLEMYNKHLVLMQNLKDNQSKKHISDSLDEYYKYIVKAFKGEYITENPFIHGKKQDAYIHVGNIDTMISPTEIKSVMEEVKKLGGDKLIILGWDFMMEATFFKKLIQKEEKITVELKKIPSDLLYRSNKGNLPFIDLPFVDIIHEIDPVKRKIKIRINDVIVSSEENLDSILTDNNFEKIDLIDFWAIDWDYDSIELFNAQEISYRKIGAGRKITNSVKDSFHYQYKQPGRFMIVINFVDILGHDTTEYIEVEFN
ncbi:MAG: site-specific DNA-methyltransferase [Candidatus Heimdallarchaeota archaeon]|nr:site-specific DNA-methyltransferase [Candidatus Heimdallarchaeota archaeon]